MSSFFCDNPKCFAHQETIPAAYPQEFYRFALEKESYIPPSYKDIELGRHEYRTRNNARFFLCDICHNAVQMCAWKGR